MNSKLFLRIFHIKFILAFIFTGSSDLAIGIDFLPITRIKTSNWKFIRDYKVVKQNLDHSCGAAALATILNEFYGQNITEAMLLSSMENVDGKASFEDMKNALPKFGFYAKGFSTDYAQLSLLTRPVVVYLKHRKNQHFSVLRGINGDSVLLADPSLGNRSYSREQFIAMWITGHDHAYQRGRFLAVLPIQAELAVINNFFTNAPRRQTKQVVEQLIFRSFP